MSVPPDLVAIEDEARTELALDSLGHPYSFDKTALLGTRSN